MTEKPDWIDESEWVDTQGLMALNARWIEHFFGVRCSEFRPGCERCMRWSLYDQLFRDVHRENHRK